ncbi:hypothetical protein Bcep1808_2142 [Burkholderia vietnamiensis G4]|uniref:Uncharacterized protein n=1 Tax=Burkholderia vietnamiensis (strain G4 / LMG 22486) TaxID=269482 RepID=A4JFU1_BURVG|nr:hypothetical protein Bcep1808_2142 [Burkholderia vietnamiensis G4]
MLLSEAHRARTGRLEACRLHALRFGQRERLDERPLAVRHFAARSLSIRAIARRCEWISKTRVGDVLRLSLFKRCSLKETLIYSARRSSQT